MACDMSCWQQFLRVVRRCILVVIFCLMYGAYLFWVAIYSGKYYGSESFESQGLECIIDLGHFKIYWNMNVSIAVIMMCLAGSLIAAVAIESTLILHYWLRVWLIIAFVDLCVRIGYYYSFCELLYGGILAFIALCLCVVEVLLAMSISGVRWSITKKRRAAGEEVARPVQQEQRLDEGERRRLRVGLARALGIERDLDSPSTPPRSPSHPKSLGSNIRRPRDDKWTVKYVALDHDSEVVYARE